MIKPVKCLVWDLDNTIWNGTLIEKDLCRLRNGVKTVLRELDIRGILLSIASANDEDLAVSFLKKKGIYHFFLYPQISWSNKVNSIQTIADKLNIALDSMGFIDDDPFELEQVRQILPEVRVYPAEDYGHLPEKPELNPQFLTDESRRRRKMYHQEEARIQTQKQYKKSHREFLRSCKTQLTFKLANEVDLPRILELMHRTHQLNATGVIYQAEDVEAFLHDPDYRIYIAELKDRFVDYGKIGVAVCRRCKGKWILLSFLLSCRILTRGVGYFFLSWLQFTAHRDNVREFEGYYRRSERNNRMYLLYQLSGFKPLKTGDDGIMIFSKKCNDSLKAPDWLTVIDGSER